MVTIPLSGFLAEGRVVVAVVLGLVSGISGFSASGSEFPGLGFRSLGSLVLLGLRNFSLLL